MLFLRKSTVYLVFHYVLDAGEPTFSTHISKKSEHFFLLFFILYNFVIEQLASKSILTNFLFFFFSFFFAFEIVFLGGFEKVYLVRRWIPETINSVNIGRIYTKK